MRRTGLRWIMFALGISIIAACSGRESTKTSTSESPAGVGTGGAGANKDAKEFVRDVAMMNMAEIELSRMALEKATSPEIKTFAQTIIDDHTAAGDKLKSITSGQSMEWPSQLDEKRRKAADELATKQGTDFERDYAEAMVEGHQDLTALLESRLDVQSLSEWKTAAAGRAQSKVMPDPKAEMGDVKVRPAKSDTDSAMKINQWAADTYPVAQKHLDTARALETATKKRSTD